MPPESTAWPDKSKAVAGVKPDPQLRQSRMRQAVLQRVRRLKGSYCYLAFCFTHDDYELSLLVKVIGTAGCLLTAPPVAGPRHSACDQGIQAHGTKRGRCRNKVISPALVLRRRRAPKHTKHLRDAPSHEKGTYSL
jgi:hypothetical protein